MFIMKALALLGSPRKNGNTDLLASEVLRACQEQGCEVEKVYLDDLNIHPIGPMVDKMKERKDDRADDDWPGTVAKVMDADIIIWASPVYWQGVTAQMKCFVDRFSTRYVDREFLDALRGKVWIVVTTHTMPEEGRWVLEPLRVWARHFKVKDLKELDVTVRRWGEVKEMPEAMERAYQLGREAVVQAGVS